MNIPFLDNWRKRRAHPAPATPDGDVDTGREGDSEGEGVSEAEADDREGVAALLSECELLRSQAEAAGVELDDSAGSLEALDQLLPRWRDDEETLSWLGNDAGLYLGTVVVRTVPGAAWSIRPGDRPVVRLGTGREIDVVADGHAWAATGLPELSQVYAEVSET